MKNRRNVDSLIDDFIHDPDREPGHDNLTCAGTVALSSKLGELPEMAYRGFDVRMTLAAMSGLSWVM